MVGAHINSIEMNWLLYACVRQRTACAQSIRERYSHIQAHAQTHQFVAVPILLVINMKKNSLTAASKFASQAKINLSMSEKESIINMCIFFSRLC